MGIKVEGSTTPSKGTAKRERFDVSDEWCEEAREMLEALEDLEEGETLTIRMGGARASERHASRPCPDQPFLGAGVDSREGRRTRCVPDADAFRRFAA